MKLGILCGGNSFEHEISIISAIDIFNKIKDINFFYLSKENELFYYKEPNIDKIIANKGKILKNVKDIRDKYKIDIVILSVHGKNVEDGSICSLLDFYKIPYIGTSLSGSLIGMDKELTDLLAKKNNIPTINKMTYFKSDDIHILNYPVIFKPARSGSSLGVSVVRKESDINFAFNEALKYDNKVIVEDYLENANEYFIAVYKDEEIHFSKIEVIHSNNDFFNYDEKYKNRRKEYHHIYLKDINKIREIEEIAKSIYEVFELAGIVRIDFMESNNELYFNEINTIPGSLANYMFDDFEKIITKLINNKFYEIRTLKKAKASINNDILKMNIKK